MSSGVQKPHARRANSHNSHSNTHRSNARNKGALWASLGAVGATLLLAASADTAEALSWPWNKTEEQKEDSPPRNNGDSDESEDALKAVDDILSHDYDKDVSEFIDEHSALDELKKYAEANGKSMEDLSVEYALAQLAGGKDMSFDELLEQTEGDAKLESQLLKLRYEDTLEELAQWCPDCDARLNVGPCAKFWRLAFTCCIPRPGNPHSPYTTKGYLNAKVLGIEDRYQEKNLEDFERFRRVCRTPMLGWMMCVEENKEWYPYFNEIPDAESLNIFATESREGKYRTDGQEFWLPPVRRKTDKAK